VGDYSPRASKIRDDETEHHRVPFGRLAGPGEGPATAVKRISRIPMGHLTWARSDGAQGFSRLSSLPRPRRFIRDTVEVSITPFR